MIQNVTNPLYYIIIISILLIGLLISYSNRTVSEDTVTYGSTSNSSGTVTILSTTSTSIEVAFDFTIHLVGNEGSVNVTGVLNAECLTAEAGFGC